MFDSEISGVSEGGGGAFAAPPWMEPCLELSVEPPAEAWREPFVVPPVDLVAQWELMDARYGDPVQCRGVGVIRAGQQGDFDLVEQIASFEQLISWARARQLVAVHALAGRASMNPSWPVRVAHPHIAAEEVAARLGSSRVVGRDLVEAARLFDGPLFPTAGALHDGDIDWGKARVIIAALRHRAGQVAVAVQDRVLPGAGARTHSQLRRDLQRALIAVDPLDAELRTALAVDERRVCRPRVLPDGMAGIWAVLPAGVAAAIDAVLTGRAHLARRTGDPRTVDQVRADTFTDALLPAHTPPSPSSSSTGDAPTGGHVCGGAGPGGVAARVDVTVALTTLLGIDEKPGELTGYGAITAQTARRLAGTGTWRRLLTDPRTGTVLDVGRRRYHPPDDLAEIVRARDRRCLSVVCGAAARDCDLDHREPFHPDGTGGATSAENLGPLCRRDHLLKTHAGWHLDKTDTNTYTWTTPTGHVYPYHSPTPPGHDDDPPPF